jgi:hypothetical protein
MNLIELRDSMDIVLKREKICQEKGPETWHKVKDAISDCENIEYEHANTLIEIYSGLFDEKQKALFVEKMIEVTKKGAEFLEFHQVSSYQVDYYISNYYSSSSLAFYVLLQLGYITEAIQALSDRIHFYSLETNRTSLCLASIISAIFQTDNKYFSLEHISNLINILESIPNKLTDYNCTIYQSTIETLATKGYEVVKSKIEGINIEINRDKKAIIDRIKYLQFDEKYAEFLTEIENYINTSSSIITSGMVSNMRSFMEGIIDDLAKRISSICNEEIPTEKDCSHMGNMRKYIKIKLELTDSDNQLINKYIDILHSEGGHSFTSNIEYFRLAKNIGIEITLLLLKKYESKYSKQ